MKTLIITGPTSSGKTKLGLEVSQKLGKVVLLSADSRQIYKGLKIVTGNDIPDILPEFIDRVFGLDCLSPDEDANLSSFQKETQEALSYAEKKELPLVIIGGTGLYLDSLINQTDTVGIPQDKKLRESLEKLTKEELQTNLKKLDKNRYEKFNNSDINNPRRLIRAIEVAKFKKHHPSFKNYEEKESILNNENIVWVALKPQDDFEGQIKKRVKDRLAQGALKEIKSLYQNYPDHSLSIFSSLGVKECLLYLDKKISKNKLISLWAKSEIDYVKRQMVWFKKRSYLVWYDYRKEPNLSERIYLQIK